MVMKITVNNVNVLSYVAGEYGKPVDRSFRYGLRYELVLKFDLSSIHPIIEDNFLLCIE